VSAHRRTKRLADIKEHPASIILIVKN